MSAGGVAWNCTAGEPEFASLATGNTAFSIAAGPLGEVPYVAILVALALMMGLGKGGVPGSSTSSVAINSLVAPVGHGCLDASVAMGVPITFLADICVVANYASNARWEIISKLLPATAVGVALGSQVVGSIEDSQARLLIGSILLAILVLSLSQKFLSSPTAEAGKPSVPAYAQSVWFAGLVGVVGGFATILTNSMGPILNVYLLALQLGPSEFVGTRATFFTAVNTLKLMQRLWAGTLTLELVKIGAMYGVIAVVGVLFSKQLVKRMSKEVFTTLEYILMSYASLRLILAGFQ